MYVCSVHIRTLITPLQSPPGKKGEKVEWLSGGLSLFLIPSCSSDLFFAQTEIMPYKKGCLDHLFSNMAASSNHLGSSKKFQCPRPYFRSIQCTFLEVGLMYSLMLPRGFRCPSLKVPGLEQCLPLVRPLVNCVVNCVRIPVQTAYSTNLVTCGVSVGHWIGRNPFTFLALISLLICWVASRACQWKEGF